MSNLEHELDNNTLFGALTVPPMIAGVTLEAYGFNLVISVCALIATGNILYGLIYIPIHCVCWAICKNDPTLFSIIKTWSTLPSMQNTKLYGARCYEPY